MYRSIIAVTFGVLIGVTFVIYASFVVSQMPLAAPASESVQIAEPNAMPLAHQAGIVAVWFAATLLSTAVTLLISRKWAPTSWVVAATMAIFAISNYSGNPAPIWMPVATLGIIGIAGWLSILVTGSTYGRPPSAEKG